MSINNLSNVEDWVTGKDVCLDEYGASDWMALDPPPSGNTMQLEASNDEIEDLVAGNCSYLLCIIFCQFVYILHASEETNYVYPSLGIRFS